METPSLFIINARKNALCFVEVGVGFRQVDTHLSRRPECPPYRKSDSFLCMHVGSRSIHEKLMVEGCIGHFNLVPLFFDIRNGNSRSNDKRANIDSGIDDSKALLLEIAGREI